MNLPAILAVSATIPFFAAAIGEEAQSGNDDLIAMLYFAAAGTPNTGPQGTGNFVAGKPEGTGNPVAGKPGDPPAANKAGANTSGAGAGAGATSAGDMGGTNASKK